MKVILYWAMLCLIIVERQNPIKAGPHYTSDGCCSSAVEGMNEKWCGKPCCGLEDHSWQFKKPSYWQTHSFRDVIKKATCDRNCCNCHHGCYPWMHNAEKDCDWFEPLKRWNCRWVVKRDKRSIANETEGHSRDANDYFKTIDIDNDDFISMEEANLHFGKPTEKERNVITAWEEDMKEMDLNKDGKISSEEFDDALKK